MLKRAFSIFTRDPSRIIYTSQKHIKLPVIYFTKRYESNTTLTDSEYLERLNEWVETVNKTTSVNEKQKIVTESTWCHPILIRIYDPHLRHHVKSKRILDHINEQTKKGKTSDTLPYTLLDLLDALSSRKLSGNTALDAVSNFYKHHCHTEAQQQMFWRVIDRNLKMGVSTTMITRLIEKEDSQENNLDIFAPTTMKVALAKSAVNGKEDKIWSQAALKDSPGWYGSRKLDGVRCITFVQKTARGHKIHFFSRTGKPFNSLEKVEAAIRQRLKPEDEEFVLDGEVCVYRADNPEQEDFLAAMGQIRTRNQPMEDPVYQVFDMIDIAEFRLGSGHIPFCKRQEKLEKSIGKPQKHLRMIKQVKLDSFDEFLKLRESSIRNGWEGLILRKNVPYEGKRSRNMLKVKEWEDEDYTVKGIETGLMRMPDTGEDKLVMTNLVVEHKGNPVSVGTGLSIQQRISFAEDPSLIIGNIVTVRYFQESGGDGGVKSLRFPSIKAVYDSEARPI
ncbi:hypothetical protein F4703DRAFT_1843919 [Phycomyces blakesleeanus]